MQINSTVLKNEEKAVFALRELYSKYGYMQYKMSKFEEYDLYVRNKDFLVSDNVITFTDTDGKLLALKPDVTLSIIKNSKDAPCSTRRVYYDENVYRVAKTGKSLKEIMQVGLECIGNIDEYCIYEVLLLAAKSLENISESFVLDVSHIGIASAVIDKMGADADTAKALVKCMGEKNVHGILSLCREKELDGSVLSKLVSTYGSADKVIPKLLEIDNDTVKCETQKLSRIICALCETNKAFADKIRIDFSVINDMSYYNGFVFKGFVDGISEGILSGGQYDKLLSKMGRKSAAVGFAVYLDMLERLSTADKIFDVDVVLLYDDDTCLSSLVNAVESLKEEGFTVSAQKNIPEKLKYAKLYRVTDKEAEEVADA